MMDLLEMLGFGDQGWGSALLLATLLTVALTLCGDSSAQRFSVQQRGLSGWIKRTFNRPRAATVLEAL